MSDNINDTNKKYDVIVVAGPEVDNVLKYVKKNRKHINSVCVLAASQESETTTYISKVSNLGFPLGKWRFFRVLQDESSPKTESGFTQEMNNSINIHIAKTSEDVVVIDDGCYKGVLENLSKASSC